MTDVAWFTTWLQSYIQELQSLEMSETLLFIIAIIAACLFAVVAMRIAFFVYVGIKSIFSKKRRNQKE